MPTYAYVCSKGCSFSMWQSIKDDAMVTHPICGGTVKRAYMRVGTYGIGNRGQQTRTVDAREKRWDRDMPAYARLRMEGHQPPGIDGCGNLEQAANDPWFIKTGGQFGVPENRTAEINEMLAEGTANPDNWSPVEAVHAQREKK